MNKEYQEKAFRVFHYTLAFVIFVLSIQTFRRSLNEEFNAHNFPLLGFAGLEAIAAVLFVIPKTLKLSGYLLIFIFMFAFIFHLLHEEVNLPLLVYAAGVILIVNRSLAITIS